MQKGSNPIAKLHESATRAVSAAESQGLKNKLTPRDLNRISITVKKAKANKEDSKNVSYVTLADMINETKEGPHKICPTTVFNHQEEAKITCDLSSANWPANIEYGRLPAWLRNRRGFCKVWKSKNKECVIMIDECFVTLDGKVELMRREISPAELQQERKYHRQGIKDRITVWFGLGIDFVAPVVIDQSGHYFNSQSYIEALEQEALPWMHSTKKLLVMQDKATWHTSKYTTSVFDDKEIETYTFKGYWKDLNWMERVIANVKKRVFANGKKYTDKESLAAAVKREFESLAYDSEYRRRLVVAFEAVCKKVLATRGAYVKWD